jgi:hypothetical protein
MYRRNTTFEFRVDEGFLGDKAGNTFPSLWIIHFADFASYYEGTDNNSVCPGQSRVKYGFLNNQFSPPTLCHQVRF